MKKIFIFLLALILITPQAHAAEDLDFDLGLSASDISFSEELVIGQEVRVYAKIHNYGKHDIDAYVRFYQGTEFIDDSQVVSVVSGGFPDEVYVDWVVPGGSFNIRAEIMEQSPLDENPSNDIALTTLFVPYLDNDLDGIPDDEDTDDDNDGASDQDEHLQGTDPFDSDTDGDGVNDSDDAYPTDPTRTEEEVYTPPVVEDIPEDTTPYYDNTPTPQASAEDDTSNNADDESVNATEGADDINEEDASTEDVSENEDSGKVLNETVDDFTKKALIDVRRINWRTYEFSPDVRGFASKNFKYEWDFGDGTTSDRPFPRHTYLTPSVYGVTLTVTDLTTGESVESNVETVHISFFNIANYQLWLLILVIIIAVIILLKILKAFFKRKKGAKKEDVSSKKMSSKVNYPEELIKTHAATVAIPSSERAAGSEKDKVASDQKKVKQDSDVEAVNAAIKKKVADSTVQKKSKKTTPKKKTASKKK